MNRKQHVRVFHITLVTLMILAFISGDFGVVQDILGYGVAARGVLQPRGRSIHSARALSAGL